MIYAFFFNIFLFKNHFWPIFFLLFAEINLTTRGPLYTCLVLFWGSKLTHTRPVKLTISLHFHPKTTLYQYSMSLMRRSNCSAPIPFSGHPWGHHFFCCCLGVLIALIFTCPPYIITKITLFFECPTLFYHTHIFSDPVAALGGGGGGRTIWPAHN